MAEYALRLSEEERARYRFMAEAALRTEGDMWQAAGVVEGARVADVGCGPGAVSAVLARLVGRAGHVWAVDRDTEAVQAATATTATAGEPPSPSPPVRPTTPGSLPAASTRS